ncbi:MAG: GreA/GreB family elongation factor [Limisphaerales bacterium]
MSKAFTRESDDADETFAPPRAPLPPGTQNYITPEGAAKIHGELSRLLETKRNLPTEAPPRGSMDARIQYLQNLIASFVVVESAASEVVRFGSTVTILQNGAKEIYRIVGVDEIDLDRNHISWLSPLARALMSKRIGENIEFRAPSGLQQMRIEAID